MAFTWTATVDGTDIADIVLSGGQIEYGRYTIQEQPDVPVAVIDLLTRDAYPDAAATYPEFGLGDWATDLSGFTDAYKDAYEGIKSRLTLGVPVVIGAGTESGFTDDYRDAYGGVDFVRYTGRVQAMDYSPATIQLTATPRSEEWARIDVGGTDDTTTIPVESDSARAIRYAAEAGITLIVEGPPSAQIVAVPPDTRPSPLMGNLRDLMGQTGGLVFTDRESFVHVQTRDYQRPVKAAVTLPPGATLVDPIAMTLDLGLVRNRVTVTYGEPTPPDTARPTVTEQDAAQIARYGLRDYQTETIIHDQQSAQIACDRILQDLSPAWAMPNVTVNLALCTDAQIAQICGLEQLDAILIPGMLLGSPVQSYEALVLGYTETLSRTDWTITFHLSAASYQRII